MTTTSSPGAASAGIFSKNQIKVFPALNNARKSTGATPRDRSTASLREPRDTFLFLLNRPKVQRSRPAVQSARCAPHGSLDLFPSLRPPPTRVDQHAPFNASATSFPVLLHLFHPSASPAPVFPSKGTQTVLARRAAQLSCPSASPLLPPALRFSLVVVSVSFSCSCPLSPLPRASKLDRVLISLASYDHAAKEREKCSAMGTG